MMMRVVPCRFPPAVEAIGGPDQNQRTLGMRRVLFLLMQFSDSRIGYENI